MKRNGHDRAEQVVRRRQHCAAPVQFSGVHGGLATVVGGDPPKGCGCGRGQLSVCACPLTYLRLARGIRDRRAYGGKAVSHVGRFPWPRNQPANLPSHRARRHPGRRLGLPGRPSGRPPNPARARRRRPANQSGRSERPGSQRPSRRPCAPNPCGQHPRVERVRPLQGPRKRSQPMSN